MRVVAFALATAGVLPTMPLHAGEPSAANKETARAWVLEGREKRKAGDLKGALERFRAAHGIMNVPTTGLEVGRTEAELGMLLEARDTLLAVTRLPVKNDEPAVFGHARADASELADAIVARIPTLSIVLKGAAAGAILTIDGAVTDVASAHLPRKLNPGSHIVLARAGTRERRESVVLAEKEQKSITLVLEEAPTTTNTKSEPATTPGMTDAGSRDSASPLPWLGLGVAVVGLGVGTWAGFTSNAKASELRDGCGSDARCPPPMHDTLRSAKTFGTISTIAFVAAGVGAGVFVIGMIARKSPSTATTSSGVGLGVGVGSLTVQGSF